MILQVTELRNQLFKVFKMIDAGEDITIVKKDSGKMYKIVSVEEKVTDIEKVAKEMSSIGVKSLNPQEMKRVFESRYE